VADLVVELVRVLRRAMAAALSAILEEQSGLELLTPDGEECSAPLHTLIPWTHHVPLHPPHIATSTATCPDPEVQCGM